LAHILVAGLGDLGSSLATQWRDAGHNVSAIRRGNEAPTGIDLYSQDLGDPNSAVLLPPDQVDLLYIILTPAARSVEGYQRAFLGAPARLLDALGRQQPLPPIVFVSSTAVYGELTGIVDEDTPPKPDAFNGRILLAAEEEISTRSLCTSVRFSGIYGPGRERLLRQVEAIAAGDPPPSPGWTNRIHRDDCVRILHFIGERWLNQDLVPPVVVGTDTLPALNTAVLNWLGQEMGKPLALHEPDIAPGKRLRSQFLAAHPTLLQFADYRAGYRDVLARRAELSRAP